MLKGTPLSMISHKQYAKLLQQAVNRYGKFRIGFIMLMIEQAQLM